MNLREIQEMQKQHNEEIRRVAFCIDPKLISYLTFQDLFDDKYCNHEFYERYHAEVYPLIHTARVKEQLALEKYIVNFINDMASVLSDTGYNGDTGETTTSFENYDRIPSSYVPSMEIEPVWEAVLRLRYEYQVRPYWERSGYTLYGNGETVNVKSFSTPKDFVTKNRESFTKSYGDTNLGKMERSARFKDTKFDYPIYVPALTNYEENSIPKSYEESIRRHLILKEMVENPREHFMFRSSIDADGNVTLTPLGNH